MLNFKIPSVRGSNQILFLHGCGDTPALTAVSDRIKYARLSARLKSREVAQRAGIAITTYCRYERGEVKEEHLDSHILVRIAKACGFPEKFCLDEYQSFRYNSAEAVRSYMERNNIGNAELARELGVSLTTVKQWKRGRCSPSHGLWESYFKSRVQCDIDNDSRI